LTERKKVGIRFFLNIAIAQRKNRGTILAGSDAEKTRAG
jgi:hypothetical protein